MPTARRPTATSAFGVGRRESHDSSGFYARFAPAAISGSDHIAPHAARDEIWLGDAREMDACGRVADDSVALVVTSPPYFAGKEYEAALGAGHIPADYEAYLDMLHAVFAECTRKLEPGGRIAVNVANLGRRPYRSLAADVVQILEHLGLLLRGEIIWRKSLAAGGSCAWGSYQSPANPVLRDVTERVVVASKGRFDRAQSPERRAAAGLPHEPRITKDEFIDATTDLWELPAESATRVGHPAPFPVELPLRLIELYTFAGDLVLDPFMGSGSTAVAAVRSGRHFAGFDTDPRYVAGALERVAAERGRLSTTPVRLDAPATPEGAIGEAVRRGERARAVGAMVVEEAGFVKVEQDVMIGDLGADVGFRAEDAAGRTWLVEVVGGFSLTRPGLRRADQVWRTIGKAAVFAEARRRDPGRRDLGPLVVLTTDLPPARSAAGKALAAATGEGRPIAAALVLLDGATSAQLRQLTGTGSPTR